MPVKNATRISRRQRHPSRVTVVHGRVPCCLKQARGATVTQYHSQTVEPETVQPCRFQSEGANLATAKNVELEVWSILDSMENDDDIDLHEVRPKDDQVRQTIYQTFQKTQEKARRQQGLGSQPRVSFIKADRSVSGKKLRLRAKNGGRASVT
jgi:hypothetical protein